MADHLSLVVMELGFYFSVTKPLIKCSHLIYNLQIESLLLDGPSVWIMGHRSWARVE